VKDAPVKLSASLGLQVRSRELKTGEIQQRDENLRKKKTNEQISGAFFFPGFSNFP